MAKGRIAGLRAGAGFGFIEPDGGGGELFFHMSDLRGVDIHDLKPRARVEFTPTPGRGRGPRAADVSVVGDDAATVVWPSAQGVAMDSNDEGGTYDWEASA